MKQKQHSAKFKKHSEAMKKAWATRRERAAKFGVFEHAAERRPPAGSVLALGPHTRRRASHRAGPLSDVGPEITIRLPSQLVSTLDRVANRAGVPRNDTMAVMLSAAVELYSAKAA